MSDYGYVDVGDLADYTNNQATGITANEIMRFPRADVQPVKRWHKYPDDIPPFDGDYLCYHKGFCNVYEYFHEKWFSESGEEVKQIDKDGLYWQDLPAYPKQ